MAKGKSTITVVQELAIPICEELQVILWDVQFVKEGASWFLRIIIDKDGGVSFEDCEKVSRKIDKLLDETDPIEQSYFLEVSSPGIGRTLSQDWHFENYKGKEVVVKTIRPIENEREFQGILISKENNEITIELNETKETKTFEKSQLTSVKAADDLEF